MGAEWWLRHSSRSQPNEEPGALLPPTINGLDESSDIHGVVKARASTGKNISLMWEGRLQNMLISLGIVSDFSSGSKPIKAIGIELSYFSSG